MTGKKNRNIFNALFLAVVFIITIYSVFHNEDLSSIIGYMKNADIKPQTVCGFTFCFMIF